MTVARLKDEMPSSEFAGWLAYFKVKADLDEKRRQEMTVEAGMQKERTRRFGGRRRRD